MIYITAWLRIGNVLEASRYSIVFPIVFNMFSSRDASVAVSLSFYGVQPFFLIVFNMFSSHDASVAVSLSFYGVQPFFMIIFNMFSSRVTSVVTSKLRKRSEKWVTQKI